ncbi:MAG: maleylpyruvate isomerase family mycothiol-dependent enzyme [Ornithinimicrobium sp.]|uniref:maleylpyruvate isomerase family mycothiol-dependent enzyme n=1 Tax=Ornithinimicrobium sp. TaxID=1977084 RepID=UPI0026E03487|nr:maleylpyruvate isomerase family mycothiol-dependent enzyme [Ornithinimicrobium sp.]MDO5740522.1 maleylpyruvate isomerase family mycothiol-dependent enzyme [Ornithinimicrobium sp.]
MPVHPAPPTDIPSLIEAYRAVVTSFAGVADGLRDTDWEQPTTCPGWSAHDHLAHVVHLEDILSGSDHPVTGWSEQAAGHRHSRAVKVGSPQHVRNDFGVWIEEGVQARRDRSPGELIAELRGLMEVRSASMYDPDLTAQTLVPSVMGEQATFEELLRLRLADIWVHEQDLRELVGRPGSLDSAGASQWTTYIMDALDRVVVRRVKAEPGTVVILETTGPVVARAGVRVGVDEADQPIGRALFSGHTEAPSETGGDSDSHGASSAPEAHPEHITTISLSTDALTRRAAGRRSTADTAYQVVGDEDLARRVLDAYVITP